MQRVAAPPQVGYRVIAGRFCVCFGALILAALPARPAVYYLTVAGLGGEPEYEQRRFAGLAADLDKTFQGIGGAGARVYTLAGSGATRAHLRETFAAIAGEATPEDDFVLVLIGHGSFDGVDYKFNLAGPDVSGAELAEMCDGLPARRQLIVNTSSASGGSIAALQRPGRGVIAATKNGSEKNATIFARYWVEALHDPCCRRGQRRLDQRPQEAFQYAEAKTAAFTNPRSAWPPSTRSLRRHGEERGGATARRPGAREGLLLTSSFVLLRLGAAQRAANDPAKRALLARKEDLERRIDSLKREKAAMSQDEYKQRLTAALVELARVQEELDK